MESGNKNINKEEHLIAETRRFAHDLRGPVMALQGVLLTHVTRGELSQDLLSASAERLLEMSRQYLEVSRKPEVVNVAENCVEELSVYELRQMIRQSVREFKSSIVFQSEGKKSNIVVRDFLSLQVDHEFGVGSQQSFFRANSSDLNRMISNLLQNAWEACDGSSSSDILLTTYIENKSVKIEVQDNGEGMNAQGVNRALNGYSTKEFGNGLGLSTAQKLLKSWKAALHIDSSYNKGTTVVLSFPIESQAVN